MRAYDLAVFILLFNGMLVTFAATGMFGNALPEGYEVTLTATLLIGGLVSGITASSFRIAGFQVFQPVGAAVIAFSTFYGATLVSSMKIIGDIITFGVPSTELPGVSLGLLVLIGTMEVLIFFAAINQMVTGGWRSYR